MTEYDEDRWWEHIGAEPQPTPSKTAPDALPVPVPVPAAPVDIEVSLGLQRVTATDTDTAGRNALRADLPKDALPGEAVPDTKSPDLQALSTDTAEPTPSQKPKCSYISPVSGLGCRAWAVKDAPFCFYHDMRPAAIAKRDKLRTKGNRRSTAQQDGLPDWEPRTLDTLEAVRDALSELFNAGAKGDITASRLSALSAISNSISKAIEGSDLEARITALELKLSEAKK
jgi:hypothetical protein